MDYGRISVVGEVWVEIWRGSYKGGSREERMDGWVDLGLMDEWRRAVDGGGMDRWTEPYSVWKTVQVRYHILKPWSYLFPGLSHFKMTFGVLHKLIFYCIGIVELPWFWKPVCLYLGKRYFQINYTFPSATPALTCSFMSFSWVLSGHSATLCREVRLC